MQLAKGPGFSLVPSAPPALAPRSVLRSLWQQDGCHAQKYTPGEAQGMSFLSQHLCDSGYLEWITAPHPKQLLRGGVWMTGMAYTHASALGPRVAQSGRVECSD